MMDPDWTPGQRAMLLASALSLAGMTAGQQAAGPHELPAPKREPARRTVSELRSVPSMRSMHDLELAS